MPGDPRICFKRLKSVLLCLTASCSLYVQGSGGSLLCYLDLFLCLVLCQLKQTVGVVLHRTSSKVLNLSWHHAM